MVTFVNTLWGAAGLCTRLRERGLRGAGSTAGQEHAEASSACWGWVSPDPSGHPGARRPRTRADEGREGAASSTVIPPLRAAHYIYSRPAPGLPRHLRP